MRKAVLIILALLAIRLLPATLRRQTEALALLRLLFEITATTVANTSKTMNAEQRITALVPVVGAVNTAVGTVNTRVGNLSGAQTSQPAPSGGSAFTSGVVFAPSTDYVGGVNFDGSVVYTGPAPDGHKHGMGHNHGFGHDHGYAHTHQLPAV